MLLKLSGSLLNEKTIRTVARAWRRAHKLGLDEPWVIVHGAGPQLDMALHALEGAPKRVEGLRVTSEAAADVVRATLEWVGADLTQQLNAAGAPAKHVSAMDGRFTGVVKDERLGRVGTPTGFDASGLGPGLWVVTPVGWDALGPLNINADEGALAVAVAMGTKRMVLATEVPGVLDAAGRLMPELDRAKIQQLLDDGTAANGMRPKLRAALDAFEAGVPEIVIGPVATAWGPGGTRLCAIEVTA